MGQTEADVVIAVVRVVPIAVRRTQVLQFVVPRTAAQHTLASVRSAPAEILSQKRYAYASPTYPLV